MAKSINEIQTQIISSGQLQHDYNNTLLVVMGYDAKRNAIDLSVSRSDIVLNLQLDPKAAMNLAIMLLEEIAKAGL